MGGLPVLSGTVQVTVRLVRDAADTVGAAGEAGGPTSVTVTLTVTLWEPPRSSLAMTVTARVVLVSWSSTAAVETWPAALMVNNPASGPARLQVMSSPSASVALKAAPTAVAAGSLSATSRAAGSLPAMTGARLEAMPTVEISPVTRVTAGVDQSAVPCDVVASVNLAVVPPTCSASASRSLAIWVWARANRRCEPEPTIKTCAAV